jgi:uncharacterized membrane protein
LDFCRSKDPYRSLKPQVLYTTYYDIYSIDIYIKKEVEKMSLGVLEVTLAIVVGTLAAIVYSLRILVLMERRIARIEMHVENVIGKIMKEELKIEKKLRKRK